MSARRGDANVKLHYRTSRICLLGLAKLLWSFRSTGQENIPAAGPVVIACNHVSNWDPLLVGIGCPREVSFLAKRELFANRVFGALIKAYNAIPLDREGLDRRALRTARRVLGEGQALLMFPEGTRSRTGRIGEARAGVAFIAASADAPIVPAFITGSNDPRRALRKRGSIRVAFGPPLRHDGPASSEGYAVTTGRIMEAIRKLKRETTPL
jgi:1-acyl-sn-glycerol-3-phosphate acyltransferase